MIYSDAVAFLTLLLINLFISYQSFLFLWLHPESAILSSELFVDYNSFVHLLKTCYFLSVMQIHLWSEMENVQMF